MTTVSCPNCGSILTIAPLTEGETQDIKCEHCGVELFVYVEAGELRVDLVKDDDADEEEAEAPESEGFEEE